MSLKLRARAPPIFLPFITFGLAVDHGCERPDVRVNVTYTYVTLP